MNIFFFLISLILGLILSFLTSSLSKKYPELDRFILFNLLFACLAVMELTDIYFPPMFNQNIIFMYFGMLLGRSLEKKWKII